MMMRAKRGLAFPPKAVMTVYNRMVSLSAFKEGFLAVQQLFRILYELSKFDDAHELASSSFAKVNTLSNFNRLFRKRKGCNPTEFREKYQKTKVIV